MKKYFILLASFIFTLLFVCPSFAGVNVTSTYSSQPVGSYITITAAADGITNPVYQFWVKDSRDDSWTSRGNYGSNTYTFTKSVPGTYTVVASAKASGAADSTAISSSTLNVAFTKMGSVSALSVSGPSGSQPVGSSATFTATATDNGGTPWYEFWLHDSNDWRVVKNWSTSNNYSLSNLQSGSYVVAVYSLDQNDKDAGKWDMAYYKSFVLNIGSNVSLTTPSSGTVNTPFSVAASAAGITSPVYQFWYKAPNGTWTGGSYSSTATLSITPTAAGTYTVIVYAKDPYAPADDTHSVQSEVKTINVTSDGLEIISIT